MGGYLSKLYTYFTVPSTNLLTYPQDTKEVFRNPKSLALSASIKGQKIHVRNVEPMFEGWPFGEVNVCYEKLKPKVEAKIATYVFLKCGLIDAIIDVFLSL